MSWSEKTGGGDPDMTRSTSLESSSTPSLEDGASLAGPSWACEVGESQRSLKGEDCYGSRRVALGGDEVVLAMVADGHGGSAASKHCEQLLLDYFLAAADGDACASSLRGACEASRSDTKWLIEELRRRVEAAGLATQVLKLVPEGSDPTAEADGEKEVDSGHNVTLLVVGCFDGGQRARRAAAATAAREGSSDAVSSLRFSGRLNRETASLIPTAV